MARRVCLFPPVAELLMMETRYQALFAAVERAINDAAPEIGTIVPRVVNAQSVEEVTTVLHEEFLRWFGDDTAGPRHAYEAPAGKIWKALLEFRKSV